MTNFRKAILRAQKVAVGETAAVPASNLEFMRYEDWHFIKSVIVPGCYLSILCTRIR